MDFKTWFQLELKKLGKSQRGLAKRMNIRPAAITEILNGTRDLSAKEAGHIADFLGCNQENLLKLYSGKEVVFQTTEPIEKIGFLEPEAPKYQIEKKEDIPIIEKKFNWQLYSIAMDSTEQFCKSKGISLEEEEAQDFIAKAYLRLKTGKKLDERALEIYYEDMVPPKIF